MKERAEYLPAVISACTIDKQKGSVTVCFREGKGTAVTQSLTFKADGYDRAACDFFSNFPVFTREGCLDYGCLEGSRAYLNLIDRGSGWEIVSADYDYSYYGIKQGEEEQAYFGEAVYEG